MGLARRLAAPAALLAVAALGGAAQPVLPATAATRGPCCRSTRGANRPVTELLAKDPAKKIDAPPLEQATARFAVTFVNMHTGELLPLEEGAEPSAAQLSHFLRCRTTDEEHEMDPRPLRAAIALARRFGVTRVEVVSGYRSGKLNEQLRKKGRQVASHSQHSLGTALDFRFDGVPAAALAAAASEVHVGGVGIYRGSNFVHLDTGPPRRWEGR